MTRLYGPVPLNEIRFVFGRAGFGAGLPWGLAEDFAEACIRLARAGIDPGPVAAAALAALDARPRSRDIEFDETGEGAILRAEDGLSALYAGPAAGDWLVCAGGTPKALRLAAVDCPLLILGVLAGPARPPGCWAITWQVLVDGERGSAALGEEGALHLAREDAARLAAIGPADMEIVPGGARPGLAAQVMAGIVESGVSIDTGAWSAVMGFFGRSLVPSTEADRLAGAGAGLVDTD